MTSQYWQLLKIGFEDYDVRMLDHNFFKCIKIIILIFLAIPLSSFSQETKDDLSDLLGAVLENHPALKAKKSDRNAARTAVAIAERQFWPTPSIASDIGPVDLEGRTKAVTARLTYPIFTGGQLTADLESANLRRLIAETDIEIAGREVAFQFIDLYRTWWFHSGRRESLSNSLNQMGQLRETLKHRTQAGVSAQLDLAQAELQLSRLQDDHRQATKQRDQVLTEMATLAGQDINPQLHPFSEWAVTPYASIADLTDRVLTTHPSMCSSRWQIALAKAELKKIKAGALPNVSLRLEKQEGSYLGALSPASRVYLNSQFTLGAGLAALPMQDQASERIHAAEQQAAATRLNLITQVQRVWNERAQAAEQMSSTARQLETQKELAASGVRLFTSGRRSWQDLLNLQREVYQLMTQQNDAEAAYLNANWRLHLLANTLPKFSFPSH